MSTKGRPVTLAYKHVDGLDVLLDLYLPKRSAGSGACPAVIYFHAGGMTVGDRTCWFPQWLHGKSHLPVTYLFACKRIDTLIIGCAKLCSYYRPMSS
jgi:hypothetical protein